MTPCPPPRVPHIGDGAVELCRGCGHLWEMRDGQWRPVPYDRGGP